MQIFTDCFACFSWDVGGWKEKEKNFDFEARDCTLHM